MNPTDPEGQQPQPADESSELAASGAASDSEATVADSQAYASQPTGALPVEQVTEAEAEAPFAEMQANQAEMEANTAETEAATAETEAASAAAASAANESPLRIEIGEVDGDLRIIGGADSITLITDESDEVEATPFSEGMRFSRLTNDAELHVPDHTLIIVREVHGDLNCERVEGEARVRRVDGDVRVEDTRVARLTWISGDLSAERLSQLEVEVVDGDAWLSAVTNYATIGRIGGDLEARRVSAITVTEAVGGDAQFERGGAVTLEGPIGGDADIRRMEGPIRLATTGGDLKVSDTRALVAHVVGGDAEIEGVSGPVSIETVGGDASLRNTFGAVTLGVVGGDLDVERAPGGFTVARTGGDAELDTVLRTEMTYKVNAGGDITLRARGDVNARFVAQSFGGEIHTRLPLTVERGRRRNLVGVLGTGAATVTLQSGGDISIVAADGDRGAESMSDEYDDRSEQPGGPSDRTYEGSVAGRKFRVRVQNGPNGAGFQFKGPYTDEAGEAGREFNFQWERGHGAHTSGEYSEQLNDLRDRAEQLARRAGEEARKYAEAAAQRVKETDWESVGREVRTTLERAMGELEDAFGRVRHEWEPRSGSSSGSSASSNSGPQRVRIEQDETPGDQGYSAYSAGPSASGAQDADATRRQVLEDLRNGRISLDEAERRLNGLH